MTAYIPETEESKGWNLEAFERSTELLGGSVCIEDEVNGKPMWGWYHKLLKADTRYFASEVMAHEALHVALRDHLLKEHPLVPCAEPEPTKHLSSAGARIQGVVKDYGRAA